MTMGKNICKEERKKGEDHLPYNIEVVGKKYQVGKRGTEISKI